MTTILRSYSFGDDSEILVKLFVHLVQEGRDEAGIQCIIENHLDREAPNGIKYGDVKFFDAYRNDDIGTQARNTINRLGTIWPETCLSGVQVDKMDIVFDGEEQEQLGSDWYRHRTRVAFIILRRRYWVSPSQDVVRRFKVIFKEDFNQANNERYGISSTVEELRELSDIERATMIAHAISS